MNREICRRSKGRHLMVAALIALTIGIPQVFAAAAAEDVTGEWELTMDFNGRPMMATLSITKTPDGKLAGQWGSSNLADVKFEGGKLTFVRKMQMRDQEFTMNFTGTLKDGKLTGTLSSDQGENAVTGVRKKAKSPVLGQWDLKYQIGGQDVTAKLIVSQKPDGAVDANWISDMAKSVVSNAKITGDKLTLSRKTTLNDNAFESTFEATVKGDTLTGTVKSQMGDAPVTGTRIGAALIGKWEITRTSDQGTRTNMLMIDTDLTGRYESFGGEIPIKDLKIDGNKVTFKTEMSFNDQTFVTEYKLTLDGKTLKGQSVSDRGTNELTGKKIEATPAPAAAPAPAAKPAATPAPAVTPAPTK
jgi:hypothetical protein